MEVLPNTPRHVHSFFWSLHRLSLVEQERALWDDWLRQSILPSALAFGMRLMDSEWERQALPAALAWELISRKAPFRSVPLIIAGWLACAEFDTPKSTQAPGIYSKMSMLIEFLEGSLEHVTVAAMIGAIEAYSQSSKGSWLKVAGGAKAEVLAYAMRDWMLLQGEVAIEFGLFVGYTAMRLAYYSTLRNARDTIQTVGPRIISLELDPIHACIARHVVNLASLATAAESLIGQAKDTVPAIAEMCGTQGVGFVFMDQRGTLFHEDLKHLEKLKLPTSGARFTADNTVKPGAPVFL